MCMICFRMLDRNGPFRITVVIRDWWSRGGAGGSASWPARPESAIQASGLAPVLYCTRHCPVSKDPSQVSRNAVRSARPIGRVAENGMTCAGPQ